MADQINSPIKARTTEELALLLDQANTQIRINEANRQVLLEEISSRHQKRIDAEKELNDDSTDGK